MTGDRKGLPEEIKYEVGHKSQDGETCTNIKSKIFWNRE